MIKLANGEHTEFTSKNGTEYWVMNLRGRYYVNKKSNYGKEVKATKEIMENIELI